MNGAHTRARLAVVASRRSELAYDPYDDAIDAAPHGVWRRLRDEAPLYYNEQYDFYALSRFADVMAASLDWQTYSSAHGTVLEMIDTTPPAPDAVDSSDGFGMMIFMDPPGHDELRRLVSRAFTPRRVAALEERTRELCAQFLDPQRDGARLRLRRGLRGQDPGDAHRRAARCAGRGPGPAPHLGRPADALRARRHQRREARRDREPRHLHGRDGRPTASTHPRDDMVSDLLAAEITRDDGTTRRLDFDEVMAFFTLLAARGQRDHRPPPRVGRGAARPPSRSAREARRRARSSCPTRSRSCCATRRRHRSRLASSPATSSGTARRCPQYSKIAMLTGSAGRDEREFADADRFDVERTFDRHVTFGYGIHFCLGASLARLEGRIVLEETLARFPHWDVDEAAVEMVRTSTVRGPVHVPVTI